MLFTEKYRPKKLDTFIGHEEPRQKLKAWILNWANKNPRKPLLIHGPPGIGKTALALALAEEFDLELLELNASMLRNKAAVERVLSGATLASSLYGKTKLLLIDDVDLFDKSDRGGITALTALLRQVSYPFILTATNPWDKKLAPVRLLCEMVQLRRPSGMSIKNHLEKIRDMETPPVSAETLVHIAESCNGDVRSALNDLQAGRATAREREADIFHQVRGIFKAMNYAEAAAVGQGDVDYDTLKLWMDENIPMEYDRAEELAQAFHYLSRADVLEGRIKKSRWILLRYCFALLTAGIALSKKEVYRKFTKYQFPSYLKEMGATVVRRAMRKAIGRKVGAKTHASVREAQSYLPLLQLLAVKDAGALAEFYGLEEEELAFILETSVDTANLRKKSE